MAIKGITYSNQRVSAADHGALFAKLFTDGIITGCGMSKKLATCTISSGAFIVAGRLTNVVGSETIEFSAGHAGYARIVGVIDMNQPSPKGGDGFAQFKFRCDVDKDYSSTVDGFGELTQDNINDRGTTYEVEWAVVAIDAQGIAGETIRYIASAEGKGDDEPGTITGNSFRFVPTDPSITGENAIIFAQESGTDNWEIAILTSGEFSFKVNPGLIDVFAVSGGRNGEPGVNTNTNLTRGGAGGRGAEIDTAEQVTADKGTKYSIVIGGPGSYTEGFGVKVDPNETTTGYAGGTPGRADGMNSTGGHAGVKAFSGTSHEDTIVAGQSISLIGTLFGASGGGGGASSGSGVNRSGSNGGATSLDTAAYPTSEWGAGADYDGAPAAKVGRPHTGQGGGGGSCIQGGQPTAGASGGSGIMIIRNHRAAESA